MARQKAEDMSKSRYWTIVCGRVICIMIWWTLALFSPENWWWISASGMTVVWTVSTVSELRRRQEARRRTPSFE
jgi:hypothetical protein